MSCVKYALDTLDLRFSHPYCSSEYRWNTLPTVSSTVPMSEMSCRTPIARAVRVTIT